jgi:hypothetical protein
MVVQAAQQLTGRERKTLYGSLAAVLDQDYVRPQTFRQQPPPQLQAHSQDFRQQA